eukprot:TRINITY_DN1232_c1_g1_i20.p1 TRINITY_DN1232_c1_g1~~TRINITY_DN1232_c1_g1_i20.p1  ORF type:complete len:220 (-),score=34.33 TRINITY_DN1232_c1_g1_i20:736-1395(-)
MHRYELARHDQLSIGLAAQRLLICVVEQHDGRVVCGTRTSGWLICIGGVNNVTFSSNVVQYVYVAPVTSPQERRYSCDCYGFSVFNSARWCVASAHWRHGSSVVPAAFVSSTQVTCLSPMSSTAGSVAVEIGNNNVDLNLARALHVASVAYLLPVSGIRRTGILLFGWRTAAPDALLHLSRALWRRPTTCNRDYKAERHSVAVLVANQRQQCCLCFRGE